MSNLIATGQVRGGDLIRIGYDDARSSLTFFKEAENMPAYEMARMVDTAITAPSLAIAAEAALEQPRAANAKTSRR
jgi:hypothetical protein